MLFHRVGWLCVLAVLAVVGCGRVGTNVEPRCVSDECVFGCHVSENRCFELSPANGLYGLVSAGTESLDVEGEVVIDGETGAIDTLAGAWRPDGLGLTAGIHFELVPQSQAPTLAVFSATGLTIAEGTQWVLRGSYPVVVLVDGDVRIAGTVDGRGRGAEPGPGGYAGGAVNLPGLGPCGGGIATNHSGYDHGGGGGGFGGNGGGGGLDSRSPDDAPASGGWTCGNPELIPLFGGSGGAGGGHHGGGIGGAGGGAFQVSATGAIVVTAQGAIDVGGAGGGVAPACGGAGGGAGGAVLLEGERVEIRGRITANGGGGSSRAGPGEDGSPDAERAAGAGEGGAGGAGVDLDGLSGLDGSVEAGGGGGAVGRIRINSRTGEAILDAAVISPDPTSDGFSAGTLQLR